MSEAKHTPGQVTVQREHIYAADGRMIADCCKPETSKEGRANAQRFAQAWNCHDDLLAACKRLLAASESVTGYDWDASDDWEAAQEAARNAIAKVEPA
jgi:hypothetical protein